MRKLIAGAFAAATVMTVGAGAAGASHVHSMQTGNGSCVLLAQNGGEKARVAPVRRRR